MLAPLSCTESFRGILVNCNQSLLGYPVFRMLCLHRLYTINSELFYVERYTRVDLRNGCVRVYGQHISLRKGSILTTGQTSSVSFPLCFFILRMLSLLWIFFVIRFALLALLGSGVGGGTRCNIVLGRSRTTVTVDISFYPKNDLKRHVME